jgi:hypothetical protein
MGWLPAIVLAVGFLLLSLYYVLTRSVTATVTAHILVDVIATFRLW